MEIDPTDHEIAELGPKLLEIEDAEELEAMLAAEQDGEARAPVITLIEDRIEKVTDDGDEDVDLDPTELTVADLGNEIRKVNEPDRLRAILEAEKDGENRDTAVRLIENRLDSVEGSEDADVEIVPPEEKHPHLDHPTADKQYVNALEDGEYRDMWVYCETQAGELIDVSKEMLGKARELMDTYNDDYDEDEQVVAVVIGGEGTAELAEEAATYGADVVLYTEDDRLERFLHKPYTEIFCDMARAESYDWKEYDEPRYTMFPATNNGRDLSALVQGELDSGLASDCSDLFITDVMISNPAKTGENVDNKEFERIFHMKRPDFSGFEYSTILCIDNPGREFHPQGASVIPGTFEVPDPDPEREVEVIAHEIEIADDWLTVEVTDYDQLDEGVDITGHDVVVCIGRGIGDDPTKGIELALDLVDAFDDAALGLTRGIVTASYNVDGHVEEYVSEERQIGETGVIVEPELYIAAGVSGAVQHKVGMDESDTIVTINTDTDARIRDFSDYYIEGDLFDVLPKLTEAVAEGELDVQALADGGAADGDGGSNE